MYTTLDLKPRWMKSISPSLQNHSVSMCIDYWCLLKVICFFKWRSWLIWKNITQPYKIIKLDITTLYTLQTVNLSGMRKTLPHWCSWASQKLARWTGFWLKSEFLVDVFKHRWSYVRKALRRDDIREEIKRRKKKKFG